MTRLQQAARTVAEGISALNQLTLGPDDELESPSDVSDVVASLSLAMSLMPRLLGQLAAFLEVEHVKEVFATGQKAGTGERVRAVSDALHRAGLDAEAMAAALDTAREECAQLQASEAADTRGQASQ
jgi:2-hydroxychromene-2-carboxylate isomerase